MKHWYNFIILALIILIAIFAYLISTNPYNVAKRDAYYMGVDDAPITIVEVADYTDSTSAKVEESMSKIREDYEDQVKFIYVHYPLANDSRIYALAAECAGAQDKFEKMHTLLFNHSAELNKTFIYKIANEAKVKEQAFRLCIENDLYGSFVDKDYKIAVKMGIDKLPLVIINNQKFEGLHSYAEYRQFIDRELAEQNS